MGELFNNDNSLSFPIHKAKYIETVNMSLEDIFSGYSKLYAMTYSYSIHFIEQIIKWFDYAEIIVGITDVDDTDLWNIGGLEMTTIDELRPYVTRKEFNIYKLCKEDRLKFYCTKKVSHGKLFLLEDENKCRVVTGSANASLAAFSGRQNEISLSFDDDKTGYEVFKDIYIKTRENSSIPLPKECFVQESNRTKFSDTETFKKIIKSDVVIINDVSSIKEKSMVDMVMDLKKNKEKVEEILSESDIIKDDGKILLYADKFKKVGEREEEIINVDNEEVPNVLIIDLLEKTAYLNNENIVNNYDDKLVQNDIEVFNKHLEGFKKYEFTGDTDKLIFQYFKLMNYMFVSPFFSFFRNVYLRRGEINAAIDMFPLFAIIYGQSGGGKTNTIKLILKMTSEKTNIVSNERFNNTVFKTFRSDFKGLPVYMDDVKENAWKNNSGDIIKNDEYGRKTNNYSCFILSLNNIGNASDEVKRRCIMFFIDCRHKDTNRQYGYGDKIGKNMTNNFYRKYVTKMLDILHEKYNNVISKNEDEGIIDLLNISSKVICEIAGSNNKYFKEVKWIDYFDTRIISSNGIEILKTAYMTDKKLFKIYKRKNLVIYRNEVAYASLNRAIVNELPPDYEAKPTIKGISMRYDKLKEDFKNREIKI